MDNENPTHSATTIISTLITLFSKEKPIKTIFMSRTVMCVLKAGAEPRHPVY